MERGQTVPAGLADILHALPYPAKAASMQNHARATLVQCTCQTCTKSRSTLGHVLHLLGGVRHYAELNILLFEREAGLHSVSTGQDGSMRVQHGGHQRVPQGYRHFLASIAGRILQLFGRNYPLHKVRSGVRGVRPAAMRRPAPRSTWLHATRIGHVDSR